MLTTPYKVLIACSALLLLAGLGSRVTDLLGGGEQTLVASADGPHNAGAGDAAGASDDRPDPLDDLRPPTRRGDSAAASLDQPTPPSPAVVGNTPGRPLGIAPANPPVPLVALSPEPALETDVPTLLIGRQPGELPAGSEPREAANGTAGVETTGSGSDPPRIYVVRSGDSLERIARRTLGDANRWGRIAALNPGVDPLRLQVGDRLTLPPEAGPSTSEPVARASGNAETVAAGEGSAVRIHEVQAGDSLSVIALRYYGDSNRWKQIYEANRDVMSSPDGLQIGTRLRIPAL